MEQQIITTFTPDAFFAAIRAIIQEEIKADTLRDLQEKLLSPKETCKLFDPQLSLVTLETWSQEGLLIKYHLGGRVFYKYSEVINSLNTIPKFKRKRQIATIPV